MKVIVYLLSIFLIVAMGRTVLLGRQIRRVRKAKLSDALLVDFHELGAWTCFLTTVAIVVVVEAMMIIRYGLHRRPYLPGFAVHLWGFSVPFFVLLVACVFFITGKRFPKWHRIFVYACACWSVPMVVTGNILISHLR